MKMKKNKRNKKKRKPPKYSCGFCGDPIVVTTNRGVRCCISCRKLSIPKAEQARFELLSIL